VVGSCLLFGAVAGCAGGGDHHEERPGSGGGVVVGEQEPNDTWLTAPFLGDVLGDCVAVAGSLFDPADVTLPAWHAALQPEGVISR